MNPLLLIAQDIKNVYNMVTRDNPEAKTLINRETKLLASIGTLGVVAGTLGTLYAKKKFGVKVPSTETIDEVYQALIDVPGMMFVPHGGRSVSILSVNPNVMLSVFGGDFNTMSDEVFDEVVAGALRLVTKSNIVLKP